MHKFDVDFFEAKLKAIQRTIEKIQLILNTLKESKEKID